MTFPNIGLNELILGILDTCYHALPIPRYPLIGHPTGSSSQVVISATYRGYQLASLWVSMDGVGDPDTGRLCRNSAVLDGSGKK